MYVDQRDIEDSSASTPSHTPLATGSIKIKHAADFPDNVNNASNAKLTLGRRAKALMSTVKGVKQSTQIKHLKRRNIVVPEAVFSVFGEVQTSVSQQSQKKLNIVVMKKLQ